MMIDNYDIEIHWIINIDILCIFDIDYTYENVKKYFEFVLDKKN